LSDNNAYKVFLSFMLLIIGIILMQVNSTKQDMAYYSVTVFILALGLLLSLYLILRTDAEQVGKLLTAIGMAILELTLIWLILSESALTTVTACIGVFVSYFLVTHIILAVALTFGNPKLELR
jgi:hypothetical protein